MNKLFAFLFLSFVCGDALAQRVETLSFPTRQSMDGLFVDDLGQLYATSGFLGTRLYAIDLNGSFTTAATGFDGPIHLAKSSDGTVYASDFSPNQTTGSVSRVNDAGQAELFATLPAGPSDLVFDDADNLYVTHFGGLQTLNGNSISKIAPDGTVTTFSEGGLLSAPVGIARDEEGNTYTGNIVDGRLVKLDATGQQTLFASVPGVSPPNFLIGHLAYGNGKLYATYVGGHQVLEFDLDGTARVLAGTGVRGGADGDVATAQFDQPNGIAVSVTGDTIFISEYTANASGRDYLRMIILKESSSTTAPQEVSLDLDSFPNPSGGAQQLTFWLPQAMGVAVAVYDDAGRVVRTLVERDFAAGEHQLAWDASDLPAGAYRVHLSTEAGQVSSALLVP